MDCTHIEALMSAALDGELSAEERLELELHLTQCPACAALYDELRTQCAALRKLDCSFPESLHRKIMDALPEQEKAAPRKPASRGFARWRQWGGMAACFVLVAAALVLPRLSGTSGQPAPAGLMDHSLPAEGEDEGTYVGGAPGPCADVNDETVQRSSGANPKAAPDEAKDAQPAPYAAEGSSFSAPAHYWFTNDQYIRVTYGYTPEAGAQIIGSVRSLDEYTARFPFDGLGELLSGYGERYFETGRLLAIVLEEPSGSIRHRIASQGLLRDQVTVVQTEPYRTEDMAAWLILAEVDATFNDGEELSVTVVPYEEAEP